MFTIVHGLLPPVLCTLTFVTIALSGYVPHDVGSEDEKEDEDKTMDIDDGALKKQDDNTNNSNPVFYANKESKESKLKGNINNDMHHDMNCNENEISLTSDDIPPSDFAAKRATDINDTCDNYNDNNKTSLHTKICDDTTPANRVCLHIPSSERKNEISDLATAEGIVSPRIFLEFMEDDTSTSISRRGEQNSLFNTLCPKDNSRSPAPEDELRPERHPSNFNFEREPTPFFDPEYRLYSHPLEDKSSSESSPDREIEALERQRHHLLSVPCRSTQTFEGSVRAPRDSTPTPFLDGDFSHSTMLDDTSRLRPTPEVAPHFPKVLRETSVKTEKDGNLQLKKGSEIKSAGISNTESVKAKFKAKDTMLIFHPKEVSSSIKCSAEAVCTLPSIESTMSTDVNKMHANKNIEKSSSKRRSFNKSLSPHETETNIHSQKNRHDSGTSHYTKQYNVVSTKKHFETKTLGNADTNASDKSLVTSNDELFEGGAKDLKTSNSTLKRCISTPLHESVATKAQKNDVETKCADLPLFTKKIAAQQARKELYKQRKLREISNEDVISKSNVNSSKFFPDSLLHSTQDLPSYSKSADRQSATTISDSQDPMVGKSRSQSLTESNTRYSTKTSSSSDPIQMTKTPWASAPRINRSHDFWRPISITTVSCSPTSQPSNALSISQREVPALTRLNDSHISTKSLRTQDFFACSPKAPKKISETISGTISPTSLPVAVKRLKTFSAEELKDSYKSQESGRTSMDITSSSEETPMNSLQKTCTEMSKQWSTAESQISPEYKQPKGYIPPKQAKATFRMPTTVKCSSHPQRVAKGIATYDEGPLTLQSHTPQYMEFSHPARFMTMSSIPVKSTKITKRNVSSQLKESGSKVNPKEVTSWLTDPIPDGTNPTNESSKPVKNLSDSQSNLEATINANSSSLPKASQKPLNGIMASSVTSSQKTSTQSNLRKRYMDSIRKPPMYPTVIDASTVSLVTVPGLNDLRKTMPVSHRLTEKYKPHNKLHTTNLRNSKIAPAERNENVWYNITWSALLNVLINSFKNASYQFKRDDYAYKSPSHQVLQNKSRTRHKINKKWSACSPFGRYTLEGILAICIMTFIALVANIRVEVFICYTLAAYYTFFVLRVLRLLD